MTPAPVPQITLNDGHEIPQLGFGVWQIADADAPAAVQTALKTGYRHFDTAQMYGNEAGVGRGVAASGVPREELFLTSKLNNSNHLSDDARRSFEETLTKLGTDYLDLFLIHWPLPTLYHGDFVSTWKVLEEFKADGRARSIGVSNFQVAHLERLAAETSTVPAVNQVENHPYFANREVLAYNAEHGIVTEAWSPLAQGKIFDAPVVHEIAERLGRAASQVVLRWHVQHGHVIFPKSTQPGRIAENFDLFDFTLGIEDLSELEALDRGPSGRIGPDPDSFAVIPR